MSSPRSAGFPAVRFFAALFAAASAWAAPDVQVLEAYTAPTMPRQHGAEVYARFVNVETDDRLIGADSPTSARVELVAGDGTRRPFVDFGFKEDSEIGFREGALHLHLVGLKHPLARGQTFVVNLHFAESGTLALEVTVR